jgi:c-di-GMP-binding flagellar brake protein YcgR
MMFERTKTFWRKWVGPGSEAGNVAVMDGQEDRRQWSRLSADLQTVVKPAGAPDSARLHVRVRNISLGGINLLASRAFQPGEMLTIEVPDAADGVASTALACVIHCSQEPTGQWAVGCDFSRELSELDLAAFGAKRERTGPEDKRYWKRFPCDLTVSYQLVADDDQMAATGRVINISATGIGLLVDRSVENGALLSVELRNSSGTFARSLLACVVHVNHRTEGDWALGCNFIRSLGDDDLEALV